MNYLAIIISTVYAMVLGSAWYSLIFGKLWMRSLGWSEKVIEKQKKMANMPLTLGLMALSALVTLLVLAALIDVIGATTAWGGALLAIWVWVGFILTTTSSTVLFEGRNPTTYWLAVGYYFVLLVPAGAFLASWS